MPLRILTLGTPLELREPDGEPYKLSNSKHLVLLAYLSLEPGSHSRDSLTRFIWSSGEAGSMNDALSSLRSVVGENVFPPRAKDITLPAGVVESDADEFLGLSPEDARIFNQALTLYRGPFLEDFNPRGASARLIAWVERKRAEFERRFLELAESQCERLAAEGDWRGIEAVVEAVLKRVSAWDTAQRWLVRAGELREQEVRPPAGVGRAPAPADYAPERSTEGPPVVQAAPPPRRDRDRRGLLIGSAILAAAAGTALFVLVRGNRPDEARPVVSGHAPAAACPPGAARAQLVEEVFHYGVRVRAGRAFAKRWTLQNDGDCTWGTNFRLHFVSSTGTQLSTTMMDVPLKRPVPPGDTAAFVLQMRAPTEPGTYEEVWELRDGGDQAVVVGDKRQVFASIKVPLPHYPDCGPGQGSAILLEKKYPDGTAKRAGEAIRYSWTLKNDGECAWGMGARLRNVSATPGRLSLVDSVAATRSVGPDETYTFLVAMRTPAQPGSYQEAWELRSGAGTPVPIDRLPATSVQLRVQGQNVPVTSPPLCPPGGAQLRFVDENWPDSSRVAPGQEFVKRWTVVNMGKCAWAASYQLAYTSNTNGQLARSTAPKPLGEIVPPAAAYTFDVPMRGPSKPGFYREDWRFVDNRGNLIMIGTAPYLAALIVVGER